MKRASVHSSSILALLVALAPAAGQEAPRADRLVSARDAIVAQMDGPELLSREFLATNLGTMLRAKESIGFWDALRVSAQDQLRRLGEEAGGRFSTIVGRLGTYSGRITLACGFAPHPQAWAGIPPELSGVLILAPDGQTDLAALAADVTAGMRGTRWPTSDLKVGDLRLTALLAGEGSATGVTFPVLIDDHLVVFFGEGLERSVNARLAGDAEPDAVRLDGELRSAAIALRVDMAPLVALYGTGPEWDLGSVDPEDMKRALGLTSLVDFRLTVRPRGPHVQVDSVVAFAPGVGRGLLGGLFSDSQAPPALAALAPEGARYWHAGKLHVDRLYHSSLEAVSYYLYTEDSYARLRKSLREHLGFDVEDDLLPHVGTDFLLLGSLGGDDSRADEGEEEPETEPEVGDASGTVCFVFPLADSQAFETAWRKLVDNETVRIGFDTERHGDADIEVHSGLFGEICWSVAGDLFLVAFGGGSTGWVKAVLDRRQSLRTGSIGLDTLPAEHRRLMRQAPAGLQGIAGFHVERLLGHRLWSAFDVGEQVAECIQEVWDGAIERLRPRLEEHRLTRAVGFTGWSEDRWTYRVLW
jgi:hypothetical protein